MKHKNDFVFTLKCRVVSALIAPVLPPEIMLEPVSHENGITLSRIQCVVYAVLSWYEGTFSLRETMEILSWYLPEKLVIKVIGKISDDIESVLRDVTPSFN